MSRQHYPEEFKIEVAKQIIDRGHSVADLESNSIILS